MITGDVIRKRLYCPCNLNLPLPFFRTANPPTMILQATHTHLYPGHRGKISGLAQIADIQAGGDCLVEFSDGSAAAARISRSENGWQLDTEAYRTAAGTDIAAKRWLVCVEEDDGRAEFRVLKKLPGNLRK